MSDEVMVRDYLLIHVFYRLSVIAPDAVVLEISF